ncbi:SRPBCC family protein [soil metagenome]
MTNGTQKRNETKITTPSETEICIEREFDAPRQLVWDAWTDADLFPEWIGPAGDKATVLEMDVRVGGKYRYSFPHGGEGIEFYGEYLEVDEPKVLAATFNFSLMSELPAQIDRLELEELDDGERTRLVSISTFESKELRDGMLESGMESGVVDGYNAMDELLERLKRS